MFSVWILNGGQCAKITQQQGKKKATRGEEEFDREIFVRTGRGRDRKGVPDTRPFELAEQ